MRQIRFFGAALFAVAHAAWPAHAQATYKRDIPDSLAAKAKVTEAAAAETARKRVPKGTIQAVELERAGKHLQYSYDIATPGKSGVDEVNVDALTGKIIGVSHETAAQVKKEADNEAKGSAARPAKPKKP